MYERLLLFLFGSYQKRAIIISTYHVNELDRYLINVKIDLYIVIMSQ